MRKHIINFLILFLCFLGLKIFYDQQSKETYKLQRNLEKLASLNDRLVKIERYLSEFNELFSGKNFITAQKFKFLVEKISKANGVSGVSQREDENKVRYEFLGKKASDIISTIKCLKNDELNLAIVLSKILIEKNSEDEYRAEVAFLFPITRDIKFRDINDFRDVDENKLQKIINSHKNKLGISMFNQSCTFEGIVNDDVIINGVWLPKQYEDDNFISTMIDNCTIMLKVKRFNKTFRLTQNRKENIY